MTSTHTHSLTMVVLVGLIIVLSITACATFRKPGDPAPTRPPTFTPTRTLTPSPEPTLTFTPTFTYTPRATASPKP
jgi:hypothetical protein